MLLVQPRLVVVAKCLNGSSQGHVALEDFTLFARYDPAPAVAVADRVSPAAPALDVRELALVVPVGIVALVTGSDVSPAVIAANDPLPCHQAGVGAVGSQAGFPAIQALVRLVVE
jgi:hypothetical protein